MKSLNRFKHLKANSLLESVTAITIISSCLLIATLIYVNVIRYNSSLAYLEAKQKIQDLIHSNQSDKYENSEYRYENYAISKVVDIDKKKGLVYFTWGINTGNNKYTLKTIDVYEEEK